MILNSPYITGSLTVTGNITAQGGIAISGSIASASYAANADLLDGRDSSTFANTGSNTLTGVQYVSQASNANSFTSTASLYTDGGMRVGKDMYVSGTAYFNNVTIYGTQSVSYITSSQLNITDNIISVNTFTPAIRFGGLAVYDSGSTGLSGSMLWDSEMNRWVYSNPSGSSYDGGMIISGPRNTTGLGNEQGTLSNYVTKGQGGDHITSSQITDDGTTVSIPGNLQVTGSFIGASSNTFGSSLNNRQQMTGSVSITGSIVQTGTNVVSSFSGKVGINSTASFSLSTFDSNGYNILRESATSAHSWFPYTDGSVYVSSRTGSAIFFREYEDNAIRVAMTITGSRVGIGTTSPTYPLTVSGSVKAYGNQTDIIVNSTASTQYSRVSFEENGIDKAQVQYINSGFSSGNRAGRLEICNAASSGQGISFVSSVSSFNTPQMFISSSGNVGIGTTSVFNGIASTSINGIQINDRSGLFHLPVNNATYLANNLYYDGANWKRIVAAGSTLASLEPNDGGLFRIFGTLTGTAGGNVTLLERFRVTGDGYVNVSGYQTNTGTGALNVYQSGSGATNPGTQIWIKGGNSTGTANSNAIVFSYSDVLLYSHAIKTTHNSAAINGNAIDFYVWNYGTDSSSTIGTRKMMSIDGTGVIKPSQPGFQVTRGASADQSLANESIVLQFNTIAFDTQGNYNTSTYRFTAPVAGRYLFTAQARYDATTGLNGYSRIYFTINGSSGNYASFQYGHQIMGSNTGYSLAYQSGTISAILQLAAGDYVQVCGGNTTGTNLQRESQFSGYLLG